MEMFNQDAGQLSRSPFRVPLAHLECLFGKLSVAPERL
jgi:hypothetical protein